jgi:RNA polymerase sigma-70 factor (ECF subfamily)
MGKGLQEMTEESRLIDDARRGSVEAFSELLRQHHTHVRAYLDSLVRHAEKVDDLAQDTFLTAFRSIAQYRGTAC